MIEKSPHGKAFISLDDQICFSHEIEIKMLMIQNALSEVMRAIEQQEVTYALDKSITTSFNIVYDGAEDAIKSLSDTLHDSELSSYKTSDEKFIEEQDKDVHRAYLNHIQSIYSENKL